MQEEKRKREIPTPAILLTMLAQLNDKAFEKEAILQKKAARTSPNYRAFLRAFVSINRYCAITVTHLTSSLTVQPSASFRFYFGEDGCELDLRELRETVSDIDELTESAAYNELKELWQNAVETQKDWLFYTSEKGRDLHFAKGWYEAMTEIDNTIKRLAYGIRSGRKGSRKQPAV